MAIYVYRTKASQSANDLAEALDGVRYWGRTRPIEQRARRGDVVVAWGQSVAGLGAGVKLLNGAAPIRSKYQDALRLAEAGVSTIKVSLTRPAPAAPVVQVDPALAAYERAVELADAFSSAQIPNIRGNQVFSRGIDELLVGVTALRTALGVPIPVAPVAPVIEWIGRRNNHVGGNDILTPTREPEYFSAKEIFVKEFRIHSFLGKSIRAGVKVLRDGFAIDATPGAQRAHGWVRSWDGGWKISYDGVTSKKKHREIAHAAVAALGLEFGAVDIGERADGTLCVLEVNRAPGLSEGTVDRYAAAIERWMNGQAVQEAA